MAEYFQLGAHQAEIVRSPRARQMRLAVDPRLGRVRLTLPKRAAVREAIIWARGKEGWVSGEMAKLPATNPIRPEMLIPVGDMQVRLEWAISHSRVPRRVDSALYVGGDEAGLSARVLRWLKREALRVLDAETRDMAAQAGLHVGRIGVGDPVSRWGSCTASGDIRYSWRLILAPVDVRRATVAHELAHRVHMNHSKAFHAFVIEIYGKDPHQERQWLRTHGGALHWFGKS
jgi:predicted metal-dependent hydrolase